MGLFDRLHLRWYGEEKSKANDNPDWYKRVMNEGGKDPVLVFIGWRKEIDDLRRLYC